MDTNEMISKGLGELKALGAEVEKAVREAGGEAREGWKKLQPHLQKAEEAASAKASDLAQEVGESAGELITDARTRLEELRARIREQQKNRS